MTLRTDLRTRRACCAQAAFALGGRQRLAEEISLGFITAALAQQQSRTATYQLLSHCVLGRLDGKNPGQVPAVARMKLQATREAQPFDANALALGESVLA